VAVIVDCLAVRLDEGSTATLTAWGCFVTPMTVFNSIARVMMLLGDIHRHAARFHTVCKRSALRHSP
jgi:hypothetical protein